MGNYLPHMNWRQARDAAARGAVAIVPIGTVEANGPQLPLGYDTLVSEALAKQAAERTGDVWLPPVFYGVSEAIDAFPGTISVSPAFLAQQIEGILDGLERSGFGKILLITHHGPNQTPAEIAGRNFRRRTGRLIASINPARIARDLGGDLFRADEMGHGAEPSVSLMMHLHPGSVTDGGPSDPAKGTVLGLPVSTPNSVVFGKSEVDMFLQLEEVSPSSGWGNSTGGSEKRGAELFSRMLDYTVAFLKHLHGQDTRAAPPKIVG